MPLSAAEKQRRYRERLKQDKQKYEASKEKAKIRYHSKKKLIFELSRKEVKIKRRQWRIQKTRQRDCIRRLRNIEELTPPPTPEPLHQQNARLGRKRLRRDRTKLYKENKRLLKQNLKLQKDVEKYRKRAFRAAKKLRTNAKSKLDSPESKTEEFVQTWLPGMECSTVRRQILKYNVLTHALRTEYKNAQRNEDKRVIKRFLGNEKLKKYGLLREIRLDSVGIKHNFKTYIKKGSKLANEVNRVRNFFKRDDISRATAGKKETRTKNKEKIQKRYLLDTMKNLHKRYIHEGGECSYTSFTRFRPFYIVTPTINGRETCLCRLHNNMWLRLIALNKKNQLLSKDLDSVINSVTCNPNSRDCMYNECKDCKFKTVTFSNPTDEKIIWWEWMRKEEIYENDGKQKKVNKMVKNKREGLTDELKALFVRELPAFKRHAYNIRQQYRAYRQCLDNLKQNEVAIHIDFSENYNCKMAEEVQGHHFGASRNQITLHTGVLYFANQSRVSFSSVSDDNQHNPAAIWAHLMPIFSMVKETDSRVNTVHIFSDGPFSQYRQKENFYLFCNKIFDWGFKEGSWSFFEAGHGKGAADGIGGALKRKADQIVAFGDDIVNTKDFVCKVGSMSSIKLFTITSDDIRLIRQCIPKKIEVLKGTKKLHQLIVKQKGHLFYRELSCYCPEVDKDGICKCFQSEIYFPIKKTTEETSSGKRYYEIYSSSDESDAECDIQKTGPQNLEVEVPSTSGKKQGISKGQYMLVEVFTKDKKKKYYYVAVAQDDMEEDGEVRVMFLKALDSSKKKFYPDERDVSYVEYEQIKEVLEDPVTVLREKGICYQFAAPVHIFEK